MNGTRQPMALAVPTHEKLGKIGFSAMNTLGLTRKQARRTCHWHTLLSGLLDSPLRHFAGKFAYITLNTPTPYPPQSAIPVNLGKPCCSAWSDFRKEFGKECDSIHTMQQAGANPPAMQSDLDRTHQSGRRVMDGREPDEQSKPPDFRSGLGWSGFKSIRSSGTEWRFFRRISDKETCRCLSFWAIRKIH